MLRDAASLAYVFGVATTLRPPRNFSETTEHFPLKKNPVYSAIARELDDAGIRHTRCRRGKHEAVEFEIAGRTTVDHHVGITI